MDTVYLTGRLVLSAEVVSRRLLPTASAWKGGKGDVDVLELFKATQGGHAVAVG